MDRNVRNCSVIKIVIGALPSSNNQASSSSLTSSNTRNYSCNSASQQQPDLTGNLESHSEVQFDESGEHENRVTSSGNGTLK